MRTLNQSDIIDMMPGPMFKGVLLGMVTDYLAYVLFSPHAGNDAEMEGLMLSFVLAIILWVFVLTMGFIVISLTKPTRAIALWKLLLSTFLFIFLSLLLLRIFISVSLSMPITQGSFYPLTVVSFHMFVVYGLLGSLLYWSRLNAAFHVSGKTHADNDKESRQRTFVYIIAGIVILVYEFLLRGYQSLNW